MSEYHTEGFVKTVSKDEKGVKFTVEAVSPYLFESKEKKVDGLAKRKMLLVTDEENGVRICDESVEFEMRSVDFASLLVVKANHMKVKLLVELEDGKSIPNPCEITSIEIK